MARQISISKEQSLTCCASQSFSELLAQQAPFSSAQALIDVSRQIWWHQVPVTGWLEAFAAHPRIGDLSSLRQKFGSFADHSKSEQASSGASDEQLKDLALWNRKYEERFGHIFIICAAGKPASVMLSAVKQRYHNPPHVELQIAAAEQQKITEQRLLKHVASSSSESSQTAESSMTQDAVARRAGEGARSPITTHMLDTALGKPAKGVPVCLQRLCPGSSHAWETLGQSATNADGRVPDLMPPSDRVAAGTYRLTFDTAAHMQACREAHPTFFPAAPFYPIVHITFQITPEQTAQHFHVPLTWNPYGYSTYRGS